MKLLKTDWTTHLFLGGAKQLFSLEASKNKCNEYQMFSVQLFKEAYERHPAMSTVPYSVTIDPPWRTAGHKSWPQVLISATIVGNESYKPPGGFRTLQGPGNLLERWFLDLTLQEAREEQHHYQLYFIPLKHTITRWIFLSAYTWVDE